MSHPLFLSNDITKVKSPLDGGYSFEWRADSKTLSCLHACRELFQAILSQAGSYLLTGSFHDGPSFCIFKAEGGFLIPGRGEFIPTETSVAKDRYSHGATAEDCRKLTALFSHIVVHWNPARHEDSMFEVAADFIGDAPQALRDAVLRNPSCRLDLGRLAHGSSVNQPISYFFGWNTWRRIPLDEQYREFWLKSSPSVLRGTLE